MPYLCARKADTDRLFGGSSARDPKVSNCCMCGEEVYYDSQTMRLAELMGDPRLICSHCTDAWLKSESDAPL